MGELPALSLLFMKRAAPTIVTATIPPIARYPKDMFPDDVAVVLSHHSSTEFGLKLTTLVERFPLLLAGLFGMNIS